MWCICPVPLAHNNATPPLIHTLGLAVVCSQGYFCGRVTEAKEELEVCGSEITA